MTDITAQLQALAGPRPGGEFVKTAIARAAKLAGLDYWRAYDIWYGKARCVRDFEREAVSAALTEKNRLETRNEVRDLRTRLAILESRLARIDPDFHCEEIGQIGRQVRGLG